MHRLAIFLFMLLGVALFATEDDRRRVRALAERGLFDTAESISNEVFEQPHVAEIDKILLAAELARSYSLHLLLLEPTQRPRIIRRLEELERNWLTPPPASAAPELVLAKIILRLQIAMTYRSLGDYQRLEADIASVTNRRAAYQQARSTLTDALERLRTSQQELQSLRLRAGNNADPSLRQQMQAWDYSITMQQAVARKSLALTLQAEEERNFELRQAAEMLTVLATMSSTEPIIVQCKIEKAASHRLAGELQQCAEILNQLRSVTLSPGCQLRLDAEWIRYQIAVGNIAETRRQPQFTADRENGHLYPDFDLARLELFLASDPVRHINADNAAAMRLEQAIDRQLGSHWARRARLLVLASGNTELNSAEMLAARADNFYREDRFAEAAALYEQAAARADASGQAENMFRYNRLAAHSWTKAMEQLLPDVSKIELQKRAVALLRKLVAQEPTHHEALEFHALAIRMQTQVVASQPEALDDLLGLVKEHAELWNDSSFLQDMYRLSVIFLERRGRLDEAAAMLPLIDLERLSSLPPEIQRLRAGQLDAAGETQAAVDILVALLNQRREAATLQLFAEILTRRMDAASLNRALQFWQELERLTERDSERWWSAREGIFVVLVKLNRREEAEQSFGVLRALYPHLGGAERKERLIELFERK